MVLCSNKPKCWSKINPRHVFDCGQPQKTLLGFLYTPFCLMLTYLALIEHYINTLFLFI
uniref:Uncharacterized protein n=1 Tax=Arundo donax TaxID=35708 RepID=A0A0A9B9D0_ARUDO